MKGRALRLGKALLIALVVVWSIAPIALVVSASFKPPKIIFDVPPQLLFAPTLDNYRQLWSEWPEFFRCLRNSLVITLGATLLTQGGPARSTEVLAVYLYKQAFSYHDFGLASATGWIMVLLSFAIALYYLRLAYRRMFAAEAPAGAAA